MVLRKLTNGLIEFDNFFTTSQANDFLGGGSYIIRNGNFVLTSGTIERNLTLDEFVLVIEQSYSPLEKEYSSFYVRQNKDEKIEIVSEVGNDKNFFKIIKHDNFIQTYESDETLAWSNIGGMDVQFITHQGFKIKGDTPFELIKYKLYRSPYLKLYNFPKEYKAILLDENNNIVSERLFNENLTCEIFLDNVGLYTIRIENIENQVIFTSDLIQLAMGDEFMFSDLQLDVIYKENILNHETTMFSYKNDKLIVHNTSNETYYSLILHTDKPIQNSDKIELSFDNKEFANEITIGEIKADEQIEFYVYITKDRSINGRVKEFSILID